jgi:hypothetical protein
MIQGTIEEERPAAILFTPLPLGDLKPSPAWVPRSVINRLSRKKAGTPVEASIHLASWKVKELGWQDLDDT